MILGQDMPARARGVENLTELQRVEKILNPDADDQLGDEWRTDLILEPVKSNTISEDASISPSADFSARRSSRVNQDAR